MTWRAWPSSQPRCWVNNEAQPSECLIGADLEKAIVPELSSVSSPHAVYQM